MYNEQELFSCKTDYYFKPTISDYKQLYEVLNRAGLVGLTISHLNVSASFGGQAGIQLLQTEPCLPCSHLLATLLPESPSKDEAYGLDIVSVLNHMHTKHSRNAFKWKYKHNFCRQCSCKPSHHNRKTDR